MKCMYELQKIRKEAEDELAKENARLDELCRQKHTEIIAKTYEFCEMVIGPALERMASRPTSCVYYHQNGKIETDRLGNKIWHPLTVNTHYADGSPSYAPEKQGYDVKTLDAYLKHHCLNPKWSKQDYKRYSWGVCEGIRLEVEVSMK